jgi:hypothetical protein
MLKKWGFAGSIVVVLTVLYIAQLSKIDRSGNVKLANLDELAIDEAGLAWEPFYKVRATIIDGQSARFSIPK